MVFLALVIIGLAVSGWQSSPYFWKKTTFLVVVIGIPLIAIIMGISWRLVKPRVIANTGNKIKSVWTLKGPRYDDVSPDDLDITAEDAVG